MWTCLQYTTLIISSNSKQLEQKIKVKWQTIQLLQDLSYPEILFYLEIVVEYQVLTNHLYGEKL